MSNLAKVRNMKKTYKEGKAKRGSCRLRVLYLTLFSMRPVSLQLSLMVGLLPVPNTTAIQEVGE